MAKQRKCGRPREGGKRCGGELAVKAVGDRWIVYVCSLCRLESFETRS